MIPLPLGYEVLLRDVLHRVDFAHKDLSTIVAVLRDPEHRVFAAPPKVANAAGWRHHLAEELSRFALMRPTLTTVHEAAFPGITTSLDAYLDALPRVLTALDTALRPYVGAEAIEVGAREVLATAIERELA